MRNITIIKIKVFGVPYFTAAVPKARLYMFICRKLGTACQRKFYVPNFASYETAVSTRGLLDGAPGTFLPLFLKLGIDCAK
jgi:hypothetical protein